MTSRGAELSRLGGFAVAGLGFAVTRLFVAEVATSMGSTAAAIGTVGPLVVGLGLTVFGVVLGVGVFSPAYVRAVTGGVACGVAFVGLVFAFTAIATDLGAVLGSVPVLLGNSLLGGAVAGAVAGDRYAAFQRQERAIRRQSNRALFVNRLLRHEVLNAASIVRGHADLLDEADDAASEGGTPTGRGSSLAAIRRATGRIESTVEDVGLLADAGQSGVPRRVAVDDAVDDALAAIRGERSLPASVALAVDVDLGDVTVAADDRLGIVLRELLANAIEHAESSVEVAASADEQGVTVTVADDGPGLPDAQRRLLEQGEFPEYDDPASGFGLQVVRLLIERFEGVVEVDVAAAGTTIVVRLPRSGDDVSLTESVGVTRGDLGRAMVAGVVAGAVMGVALQWFLGAMPIVGALYGVQYATLGWVTHMFHSIVFALLFAVGWRRLCGPTVSRLPLRSVSLGLAWGSVLWAVAFGVVMPLWLRAVGIEAPVPNLTAIGYVGHALWGITLGGTFALLS